METVNFDHLCDLAYGEQASMENKNALWKAAFELKEWIFISRGELPNPHPYVCRNETIANNEYMFKAFTDSQKLYNFAKENNLLDDKGEIKMLAMPVGNIINYLLQFQESGVWGIHFNADSASNGFFSPLAQLEVIKNFCTGNNPGAA